MQKVQSFIGVFIIIFLLFSHFVSADVYMKQKMHTGEMNVMGTKRPAQDVEQEIWITEKGYRTDNPERSVLMLFDEQKMYMIDHQEKTYMEMPMDMEKISSEMMKGQSEQDMQAMQGMMQNMMKIEANVEMTDEQKKINDWDCKKYILNMKMMMGNVTQEIWATEDLEVDKSLYKKFASSTFSAMPGMQNAIGKLMEEMEKIKGVHVKTITTQKVMNQTIESSTELVEFKKTPAPDNIFKLPDGYKKTSMR